MKDHSIKMRDEHYSDHNAKVNLEKSELNTIVSSFEGTCLITPLSNWVKNYGCVGD